MLVAGTNLKLFNRCLCISYVFIFTVITSLSSREGFKIQVIPEAGSYDSLRALAQTSPDFNVLVLNFERINVSSGILPKQLFLLVIHINSTFFQVYHLN